MIASMITATCPYGRSSTARRCTSFHQGAIIWPACIFWNESPLQRESGGAGALGLLRQLGAELIDDEYPLLWELDMQHLFPDLHKAGDLPSCAVQGRCQHSGRLAGAPPPYGLSTAIIGSGGSPARTVEPRLVLRGLHTHRHSLIEADDPPLADHTTLLEVPLRLGQCPECQWEREM
jgi:hypothetical protein